MIVDIRQSIGPHVSLGTFWLDLLERKIAQYARRPDPGVTLISTGLDRHRRPRVRIDREPGRMYIDATSPIER
jgi:hypothetical protein